MLNETSLTARVHVVPDALHLPICLQLALLYNNSMRIRCRRHLPPHPVSTKHSLLNGSLPAVGYALKQNPTAVYVRQLPGVADAATRLDKSVNTSSEA